MVEEQPDETDVVVGCRLAEVGCLASVPQADEGRAVGTSVGDQVVGRQCAEGPFVERFLSGTETILRRRRGERLQQRRQRSEVQGPISPQSGGQGVKGVSFHGGDQFRIDRVGGSGDTERAVGPKAAGAPGDLPNLVRMERPLATTIELGQPGEGHMVDVHVEAHAYGVGGHEEVDLA